MTEAEVRVLAAKTASGGTINSFLTSEVCKTAFSQSLEAHGTHAGMVAAALHEDGAFSPETAVRCGDASVYAPDTGSLYDAVLIMEREGRIFALAVEWGNKPDPELEAIVDRALGDHSTEPRDRTPDHSLARKMRAYTLRHHGEVPKLITDAAAGAWRPDGLFSTSSSFESFLPGKGWLAGAVGLDSDGIDLWEEFFAALRATLTGAGDAARIGSDAAEMASRIWSTTETKGLEHYDAARELGQALARADDFLPGPTCATGLATLYAVQAELDIDKLLGQGYLDRIHAACIARGHVAPDSDFDFNDLDDHVYASERNGARFLYFRDQNRRSVVEMRGDAGSGEILVRSTPVDAEREPAPLARFAMADGRATALKGPGLVGDDIRAWNSFVSIAESADCVLEEEYGSAPAP